MSTGLSVTVGQRTPMPLAGSFTCEPGRMLALVGPSGAGKTSMLRVLAGLMRPTTGRVQVGTEVWCDTATGVWVPPQQRHVGLVFQHYALFPHLTVADNIAYGKPDATREEIVAAARAKERWFGAVRRHHRRAGPPLSPLDGALELPSRSAVKSANWKSN